MTPIHIARPCINDASPHRFRLTDKQAIAFRAHYNEFHFLVTWSDHLWVWPRHPDHWMEKIMRTSARVP